MPNIQQRLTPSKEYHTPRLHSGAEADDEQLQDTHMQQQPTPALGNQQRQPQSIGGDAGGCRKSKSQHRLQLFASSSSRLPAGPELSDGTRDSSTHSCEQVSEPDKGASNARSLIAKACALLGVKSKGASPGLKSDSEELSVAPDELPWYECENWAGLRSRTSAQEMQLSVPD